jgi:predicted esterase YcpF (UPF0227 family)
VKTILYAHGFRSSSQSRKTGQLRAHIAARDLPVRYLCPDLSFSPSTALNALQDAIADVDADDLTIVGSSLGGFYAIVLAERLGCRAVLLNPSIRPFETLAHYLGKQTNLYTGERFIFDRSHIAELQAYYPARITQPERYLVIVEMGDELLDHHHTLAYLSGAAAIIVEGGDHELKSFPQHIDAVLAFAGAP